MYKLFLALLQVLKAVTALTAHLNKDKKKADLLEAGTSVFVNIRQFRIPGREKGKPIRMCVRCSRLQTDLFRKSHERCAAGSLLFPVLPPYPPDCSALPHSVLNPEDGVSLCVIVKDPAEAFKEQLAAAPVPGFVKVIGAGKLRKNFSQYKDRIALANAYDGFFADDRVVRMMPQVRPVWQRRCAEGESGAVLDGKPELDSAQSRRGQHAPPSLTCSSALPTCAAPATAPAAARSAHVCLVTTAGDCCAPLWLCSHEHWPALRPADSGFLPSACPHCPACI